MGLALGGVTPLVFWGALHLGIVPARMQWFNVNDHTFFLGVLSIGPMMGTAASL
jgi:hypothetical protein